MSEQTPAIEPIDGPRSLMADVRVLIPALAPLLLWFGYVNHTRRERSLAPLLWQVVAIASVLAATIAISATRV